MNRLVGVLEHYLGVRFQPVENLGYGIPGDPSLRIPQPGVDGCVAKHFPYVLGDDERQEPEEHNRLIGDGPLGPQPVAVDHVLEVVELLLDLVTLAVLQEGGTGIGLAARHQGPVSHIPVTIGFDRIMVPEDFPSPHRRLLDGEEQ